MTYRNVDSVVDKDENIVCLRWKHNNVVSLFMPNQVTRYSSTHKKSRYTATIRRAIL